jgi:hypothetical protein
MPASNHPTETSRVYSGTMINDLCSQVERAEKRVADKLAEPSQCDVRVPPLMVIAVRVTFVVIGSAAFAVLAICAIRGTP